MRVLALTLLTFKKVKLTFGHPVYVRSIVHVLPTEVFVCKHPLLSNAYLQVPVLKSFFFPQFQSLLQYY